MSSKRVAGRVALSFVLISTVLSGPPHANDKLVYAATETTYSLSGGAKVVRVGHPGGEVLPTADSNESFAAAGVERRTVRVARGQTLADILLAAGVDRIEAARASKALAGQVNLRGLQIGQRLELFLAAQRRPSIAKTLIGLALDLRGGQQAVVYRDFGRAYAVRRMSPQAATALLQSIVVVDAKGEPGFVARDLVLRKGQNINRLLIESGASATDGHGAANKLNQQVDLHRLQIGQRVTATFETFTDGRAPRLAGVAMTLPGGRVAVVGRDAHDHWRAGPAALAGATPAAPAAPAAEKAPELPVVVALGERPPPAHTESVTIVLDRGDILYNRLIKAGATSAEADRAVADLAKVLNLRKLQIGEQFRLGFTAPAEGGRAQLTGLSVTVGKEDVVVLGWPVVGSGRAQVAAAPSASIKHVAPAEEAASAGEGGEAETAPPPTDSTASADVRLLTVARGDTLVSLLTKAGIGRSESGQVLQALRRVYNPNRLSIGQRLVVEIDRDGEAAGLATLTLEAGTRSAVTVERARSGRYAARKEGREALEAALAFAGARGRARASVKVAAGAAADADADPESLAARVNGDQAVDLERGARKIVTLDRGGTLIEALVEAGSTAPEAHAAIESVRELYNPRRLQAGQAVSLTFVAARSDASLFATAVPTLAGEEPPVLGGLTLDVSTEKRLEVVRLEDGRFVSGFVAKDLVSDYRRAEGTIRSSLYEAIIDAGVPVAVMMELIRIYSFDVDFQRDIHDGDRFELMYEMLVDEAGEAVKPGAILYAALELSGAVKEMYRYRLADGRIEYFDAQGRSVRKALLRTPVSGAELSSGFGMRKHPILGYSKMHKGVDFAARRGAPVFAAGEGVVERASRFGAYGNYVRIRHSPEYATAYAHLNGFAKGIYPGKRVVQGQTVGYVGTTGRSTGPHLHYEVLLRDKQVNPLSVKLPTGIKLADNERATFLAERERLRTLYAELPSGREVAQGGSP
ncbi:MAG TPA: peptidoglycan DD-metalloendopeptidase family protein [Alphaproteobacteria bacterium]